MMRKGLKRRRTISLSYPLLSLISPGTVTQGARIGAVLREGWVRGGAARTSLFPRLFRAITPILAGPGSSW